MTATAVESSNVVIEAENLCKDRVSNFLRRRKRVLNGLSLRVERGVCFGLIGANGAGKTTTIKLLTGLLRPDEGSARVLYKPAGSPEALARVGFLPESPYFYSHLTGREFLIFAGMLCGLSHGEARQKCDTLLERVKLEAQASERTGNYSKGMLQRLGIAQALISDPEVLFLDEPMSGLDPIGRVDMRRIVLDLKAEGRTIFFNSHLLNDVATLCDRVGILDRGRLIAEAALTEISAERNPAVLEEYFLSKIEPAAEAL